jgi:hypothetical protein
VTGTGAGGNESQYNTFMLVVFGMHESILHLLSSSIHRLCVNMRLRTSSQAPIASRLQIRAAPHQPQS